MRLEHINLVVNNLDETLQFYQALFPHWKIRVSGEGEWYGKKRNWCHFGDDYSYLSFNDNGEGENRNLRGHTPGLAHFAYETQDLDGLVTRMANAGYKPRIFGQENNWRKNAYFIDPDGNEVEFIEYLSDLPEVRNNND